jgi:putative hemolysin
MDRFDETLLAGPDKTRGGRRLSVGLARDRAEIHAAQRLRWRIFAGEMGARLCSAEPGLDEDRFDPFCDHLVVRDANEIVGTYRILAPDGARRAGAFYSETEFDLSRLQPIRGRMAELGRACIDPRYRSGGVIALLWSGISRYALARGYEYLAGCASMSLADGGGGARVMYVGLPSTSMAPTEHRVFPRRPLPAGRSGSGAKSSVPPLLKGYLRCGAYVCGEPSWDPEFDTADFFMLLPMSRMAARYARHFVGGNAPAEAQTSSSTATSAHRRMTFA